MILSPVPTGQWIELRRYHEGYRYVAFKAAEKEEVNIYCLEKISNLTFMYHQIFTVSLYEARPDSLVYLDHGFHVLDLQVILCNQIAILFVTICIVISLASVI